MTTGLLGDTLFLDQLQKTSEILGGQVQNVNPFGNYNPTLASDFVNTPFGVPVAQNRFVGNQFQTPDLTGSTYTPGNFSLAPGAGFNFGNFGSYTPLPFNQGNVATTTTQPGLLAEVERAMGGRGGDRLDDRLGGIGLERVGNMNLSIDPLTGRIEVLDPSSISSSLLTDIAAVQKFTPAGLLNSALSGNATDYGKQLDRIEQQYGKAVADEIAATVRESYGPGKATPSGVLRTGLQIGDKVDLGGGIKGFINKQGNFQRGTPVGEITKPTPAPAPAPAPAPDPTPVKGDGKGPNRQASKADRDRASKGKTGGGFCFDPSTLVQMFDGSEKRIKDIKLGDKTKGGEVTGVFQFKASDEIHNYKGVTVAGSHYVKENGKFIMVQDSPISVKIDKIPVVYSLDTTRRRIFIKDIEFADYNGDGIAKGFLANAGVDLTGFDKEVLRQVENRLI